MTIQDLSGLLDRDLRRLYCVESELFGVLPDLSRLVYQPELTEVLGRHRAVTLWQRERLQMIPRAHGLALQGDYCHDVAGILRQTRDFLHRVKGRGTRDAAALGAMRRVTAIQRADYQNAVCHARALDEPKAMELLQRSLDEEIDCDERLAELQEELTDGARVESFARTA